MPATRQLTVAIDFHSMDKNTIEVNGCRQLFAQQHSSKYIILCSTEEMHSYRFGNPFEWANDDNIFIFGWTGPLKVHIIIQHVHVSS